MIHNERGPLLNRPQLPAAQRGMTLIVALVMLLIFAVIAATGLNGTLTSVQAISNMQWRNEATNAANDAIDQLLSSADFATKTDVVTTQVNLTPYTLDITGDGVNDVQVTLIQPPVAGATKAGPYCMRARTIPTIELDILKTQDRNCFGSATPDSLGLGTEVAGGGGSSVGLTTPDSICANTEWAITVRAQDTVTNTTVDVTQGVGVRVFRSDAATFCK